MWLTRLQAPKHPVGPVAVPTSCGAGIREASALEEGPARGRRSWLSPILTTADAVARASTRLPLSKSGPKPRNKGGWARQ
ncbi:hypothetical protein OPT61_g6500 [Boeremia exigua]|uniref:Uncharacterized protein n=1 Tax=Boeremia exigua TaxID=749465 RepID=A0ACC2I6F5_9PLEO|nr:hypothetical protein OPT61_g6500 [Boeremia exigua]